MTSSRHHTFHETRLRVRYAETDQMGVVYHSNHLIWFEVDAAKSRAQVSRRLQLRTSAGREPNLAGGR